MVTALPAAAAPRPAYATRALSPRVLAAEAAVAPLLLLLPPLLPPLPSRLQLRLPLHQLELNLLAALALSTAIAHPAAAAPRRVCATPALSLRVLEAEAAVALLVLLPPPPLSSPPLLLPRLPLHQLELNLLAALAPSTAIAHPAAVAPRPAYATRALLPRVLAAEAAVASQRERPGYDLIWFFSWMQVFDVARRGGCDYAHKSRTIL